MFSFSRRRPSGRQLRVRERHCHRRRGHVRLAFKQPKRHRHGLATQPPTPALRREQINHQIALANALMHIKGHAAADTKEALDRARSCVEQAEALGEQPEDPLTLFSLLYGVWVANLVAFNGQAICDLATDFVALAQKQKAAAPLMIGHRLVAASLLYTARASEARVHLDQALALYDPAKHGPLATRFGYDVDVATLSYRALALWLLGYPDAALRDAQQAIEDARARADHREHARRTSPRIMAPNLLRKL
jgi:tetratricopeptide (TPR) repeat protein